MTPPLITVGITCYNAQDTVARAIESARAQDWPRLEILVVDDCSSDGSPAAVQKAATGDERVRLIRHAENRGPGAARQTLLDEARGDYLVFFDDDDVSAPARVATQYRRLAVYETETGRHDVACYASGERIYPNGYRLRARAIGSEMQPPAGRQVADYLLFNRRAPRVFFGAGTPACALMASTATMRGAGGFDPAFRRVEDVDFAVRLAVRGGHFIGCPETLYTQYATQAPDKSARRNFEAELQLIEKNRAYLEQRGRYHFARAWFTVRYHHFNHEPAKMIGTLLGAWVRHPLLVTRQMFTTVPARAVHEWRMSRSTR